MILRLVVVVLLLALVLGGIFGWKYHEAQQMAAIASMPPPPATVASAEVRSERWQPYLRAVGSVVASAGVFVAAEIAGLIEKIHFESGQQVKEGDLLVQLDADVDQADLQGLIAEQRLADIQYQRLRKLVRESSVSRSEYDQAAATLDGAQAQVASMRAKIEKKSIRAPFSGVLGIRQVNLGEYLAPGARIVSLQSLDPIYVDYSLPERNLAALEVGQEVLVEVQAYPERSFPGRITAIDSRIDTGTRNVRLRATLANPEHLLRPGMFAQVRTQLPAREDVLTVPRTAVTYNPYGESVFVIEKTEQGLVVQRRQVETGEVRDGRVEIRKGLAQGEQVVAAGQVKLRNDQPVTIDNSVRLEAQLGES
jgi:membrane fusion protein (multidrug efflux system)